MSGVPVTIPGLPTVTPTVADLLAVWDSETGIQGKASLTALGTVLALLSGAEFTGNVDVKTAVNSRIRVWPASGTGSVAIIAADNGASWGGGFVAGNNNHATTPAAGFLAATGRGGATHYIWPNASGIWYTNTTPATNATDSTGTVIGSQSSSLDQKDVEGDPLPADEVLALIAQGAAAVRRFRYKVPVWPVYDGEGNQTGEVEGDRPYGGEEFSGVVVDYAGRYGTDRDEAHPNGRSLNTINAIGDLLIAVNWLVEQNAALVARLDALEVGG